MTIPERKVVKILTKLVADPMNHQLWIDLLGAWKRKATTWAGGD